jgi:sugar O-acyltransferase (sialic acid O-acetyltransferase NeuD family)
MIIVGAGSAGIETANIVILNNPNERLFFFDENIAKVHRSINNYQLVCNIPDLKKIIELDSNFCVAIGNPRIREKMYKKMISLGATPKNISDNSLKTISKLEENASIFQPGISISYDVKIGKSCLIHANSVIGHKVEIGDFVNISPLCSIIGPAKIGKNTYIGAGAIILPNLQIGNNVYITAGSLVNKDLKDFETF